MSLHPTLIASVVFAPIAAYGALGIADPELAFRLENVFQLREVELSTFGILVHKAGGFVAVIACVILALGFGGVVAAVVVLLSAAAVPLHYRRRFGRFTVEPI